MQNSRTLFSISTGHTQQKHVDYVCAYSELGCVALYRNLGLNFSLLSALAPLKAVLSRYIWLSVYKKLEQTMKGRVGYVT